MDEQQFDQGPDGWRRIAGMPDCDLVAADLLRDYQAAHGSRVGLLYWHEAQLRAFAGQGAAAIALMQQSRKPDAEDRGGWNPYVDATIAFLRRDRAAFERARATLAAYVTPPGSGLPPVKDGYVDVPFADGQVRKVRWPPNIDVVDGLAHCFDQPYQYAYGDACRQGAD